MVKEREGHHCSLHETAIRVALLRLGCKPLSEPVYLYASKKKRQTALHAGPPRRYSPVRRISWPE